MGITVCVFFFQAASFQKFFHFSPGFGAAYPHISQTFSIPSPSVQRGSKFHWHLKYHLNIPLLPEKPVSAIILFQIVFLFYNSYISKANVPTTISSSPVSDFNDSFSWNTIYENATVTRILSLSMGTITLAGPV